MSRLIILKKYSAGRKTFLIALFTAIFLSPSVSIRSLSQGNEKDLTLSDSKIDIIISGMSLEEKIAMLHGNGMFSSAGISRLGIPEMKYTDGPFGIREELEKNSWNSMRLTTDSATFFPTGSALAATWSPDLAYLMGTALGEEAKTRGKDIFTWTCCKYNTYSHGRKNF